MPTEGLQIRRIRGKSSDPLAAVEQRFERRRLRFPKIRGMFFGGEGGPYSKNYSIWESKLGFPLFWEITMSRVRRVEFVQLLMLQCLVLRYPGIGFSICLFYGVLSNHSKC